MQKMDEMENQITFKSIKFTWIYTVIFLIIWSVYEYVTTSKFGLAAILFLTQNVILMVSKLILTHMMVNKNE